MRVKIYIYSCLSGGRSHHPASAQYVPKKYCTDEEIEEAKRLLDASPEDT
jgi:hypothetical protein